MPSPINRPGAGGPSEAGGPDRSQGTHRGRSVTHAPSSGGRVSKSRSPSPIDKIKSLFKRTAKAATKSFSGKKEKAPQVNKKFEEIISLLKQKMNKQIEAQIYEDMSFNEVSDFHTYLALKPESERAELVDSIRILEKYIHKQQDHQETVKALSEMDENRRQNFYNQIPTNETNTLQDFRDYLEKLKPSEQTSMTRTLFSEISVEISNRHKY